MSLAVADRSDEPLALAVDETRWERLAGGVACTWRTREAERLFRWHVVILIAFAVLLAVMISRAARDGLNGGHVIILPVVFGQLVMFAVAVMREIRGRGMPSRLIASERAGLRYWRRVNERPRVIPRDAIADVVVDGYTSMLQRGWRILVLRNDGRRPQTLFIARCRSELAGTCSAIRHGLGLRPRARA